MCTLSVTICEQEIPVTIGVFDLLGCTHNVLKCVVLCLHQVLVSGFFRHYKKRGDSVMPFAHHIGFVTNKITLPLFSICYAHQVRFMLQFALLSSDISAIETVLIKLLIFWPCDWMDLLFGSIYFFLKSISLNTYQVSPYFTQLWIHKGLLLLYYCSQDVENKLDSGYIW